MPSRSNHSKSRHGCLQCKRSHIRCDLTQPKCGKCIKSGKACHFPYSINAKLLNTPSALPDPKHATQSLLLSLADHQYKTTPTTEIQFTPRLGNVCCEELELLHHFSTVTYATMAIRDDLRRMWQIDVPKMALKQSFLMHSIFSVTALHIASSSAENQALYTGRAIHHYSIALEEYSNKLKGITKENNCSLIICASLTVVFALSLAMSSPTQEPMQPIEELLGIFTLLRGLPLVLGETWSLVQQSEIAPLFVGINSADSIVLSDEVTNAIQLLEDQIERMAPSDADRDIYVRATQGVKDCFKLVSLKNIDNGMALSWPVSLSPEYTALLSSRQDIALVILAHYAVILNEIRDTWWAKGWGSKLIQEVNQVVSDEWKSLVAWPMYKIGMGK